MPTLTRTLSRDSSFSSTLLPTDGHSLSAFGRAASLSADAYRVSAAVPRRRATRSASTKSTMGLLTPCASQASVDAEDGHWYTYGDEHARAHTGEERTGRGQPERGAAADAEEVLWTVLEDEDAELSDMDTGTEDSDTETEVSDMDIRTEDSDTETETDTDTDTETNTDTKKGKGEKTPSNSLRALDSRHSTGSRAGFNVSQSQSDC